jgi:hypothetical protein
VKETSWPSDDIDRFVLARLEDQGLAPAPDADRSTLLRRVSLDLTGLPPTPAELNAFLHDTSAGAYEKVVDRLLASPRYGERMSAIWLDLARYADTHGYQADRYRAVWPYRDWVISAFNRNLPYDQFVTWQIAGDLLPHATREQKLATCFDRLHMQNEEGGIVAEEYRVAYNVDRVDTFGTAFLGLTMECTRCHDHKFDPLTQRDYYSMFAFFQNIDESGQTSYFTSATPVPALDLPTPDQERKIAALHEQCARTQRQIDLARPAARSEFEQWLVKRMAPPTAMTAAPVAKSKVAKDSKLVSAPAAPPAATPAVKPAAPAVKLATAPSASAASPAAPAVTAVPTPASPSAATTQASNNIASASPPVPGLVASFDFDKITAGTIANGVDAKKPGRAVENPRLGPGKFGTAALLSGENGFVFPGIGHFRRADPFTIALWLRAAVIEPRAVVLHHSKAPIDAGSRGYELLLENGHVAFGLHHMWPGNSLKVSTKASVAVNQWTHIAVTYDGSSRAAGLHIYIDGVDAPLDIVRDGLHRDITYAGGEPDLAIGFRFRDNGFKGGQVDDLKIYSRALTGGEAGLLAGRDELAIAWRTAPAHLSAAQRDLLWDYFQSNISPALAPLRERLQTQRRQENAANDAVAQIMTMRETSHPKPAFILKRGAYDAPGERVSANTPASLPPFPADQPRNRLGLARWTFAPANPLAARVEANRLWLQMFGRGLVATSDNFGSQGAPPDDQPLLDDLAADLRDHGWDIKRLLKRIALSRTYRQSSRADAALLAIDPANALLARGPARRLTAEMLRDQALFDAGLLVEKLGGPSVKPYQPPGVWDVAMGGPHYDQGHGDDLHRRSLYTFWKRSVPPPSMMAFDASTRNVCTAQRQSTSTPLQALVLLNDPQIVEASRFISQRMLKEGGKGVPRQVAWVFSLIADRQPTARELPILIDLFNEQRALFAARPDDAAKLLKVGEAPNDPALNPLDLAAGAVLAQALLNDDDAVMKR